MSLLSYSVTDPRLAFKAKHLDAASNVVRDFVVLFYPEDTTIEILCAAATASRTHFLKRTRVPTLTSAHFFIGAEVVLLGRLFSIVGYGDAVTQQLCERVSESTVVVLSGEKAVETAGTALDVVTQECGFTLRDMHVMDLRRSDWEDNGPAAILPTSLQGAVALVLFLNRDDAHAKAAELPRRLAACGGRVWAATTKLEAAAAQQLQALALVRPTAVFDDENSTVVVIKPEAVARHMGGDILRAIVQGARRAHNVGLKITALSQITLPTMRADAFLQPYKGVLPEYRATVEDLASGPVWAVQLVSSTGPQRPDQPSVVDVVRALCGPFDPAVAKVLRPTTVRAKFGSTAVRNAVHCTDLTDCGPDDAMALWGEINAQLGQTQQQSS
jgi:nucleoside-diphosphate kinase